MLHKWGLWLALFAAVARGWNVPGVGARLYNVGDKVPVRMVKLASARTHINYAVYSKHTPFCKPEKWKLKKYSMSMGQVLFGERHTNSPYDLKFLVPQANTQLCTAPLMGHQKETLIKRINEEYKQQWIIDNLPVTAVVHATAGGKIEELAKSHSQTIGIPLGYEDGNGNSFVFDHLSISVHYSTEGVEAKDSGYIVGITVAATDSSHGKAPLQMRDSIDFTYSVDYVESSLRWAHRWDPYLTVSSGAFWSHTKGMVSSILMIVCATIFVGYIIIQVLRKDIHRYNAELGDDESLIEETGWKLVAGDVFRPPRMPILLSALYGSGIQLIAVCAFLATLGLIGLLAPSNRGALLNSAIAYFVLAAVFAGYYSGNFYRLIHGERWKKAAVATAMAYPACIFVIVLFANTLLKDSSNVLPVGTVFGLFAIWILCSVPLVLVGSFFGFRKPPIEVPVRTNQIPRIVPTSRWYVKPFASVAWAGLLPLFVIYFELQYIMDGIWGEGYFYLVGIIFVLLCLMFFACAEMAVLAVYLQLCDEQYHWWWRSFFCGGSVAFYVFFYSIAYMVRSDVEGVVPTIYFMCVSAIMSLSLFVACGTVGLWASLHFVRKMYGSLKID